MILNSEYINGEWGKKKVGFYGQKFNRLMLINKSHVDKHGNSIWNCLCNCGNKTLGTITEVKNGTKKSCGCIKRKTLEEKFWRNVKKGDSCWYWKASRPGFGYGRVSHLKRWYSSHRLSWLIHFGKIPTGLFVCHHCDNPGCVNPSHLFTGTASDNMQDMVSKKRHPWGINRVSHEKS